MFYASTARAAVFYELDTQPGQHIAIGRWCVNSKLWINNVGFTPDILRGHGANRDPIQYWQQKIQTTPASRLVHKFLGETFVRRVAPGDEHEYKLSVAIAEKLCGGTLTVADGVPVGAPHDGRFAGLPYPALAMRANADNRCAPA